MTLLLIACTSGGVPADAPAAATTDVSSVQPPNIIYILADDLGYGDLGSFGQQTVQTPHLDAMAAGGLRLTQHYAGSTVCAPSRCVLMTGKHVGNAYIRGNNRGDDGYELPIPEDEVFVSELLKDAGYHTACIGKWGLGGPGSTSHPNAVGFDYFYGFLNHGHAHNHYPDYLWRNDEQVPTGNVMTDASRLDSLGKGVAVERVAYAGDLFFREAGAFLDRASEDDKPFFLYLALSVPHTNNEAPRLLKHMPEEARPQRGQEVPSLGRYANEDWPGPQIGTAAMITRMDAGVGELLARLQALGIAENTLIIFSSDNGPHAEGGNDPGFFDSNGPLRGIKRDLYEGGIRVPTIAYWPGTIEPGRLSPHLSGFQDLLPTACDLADIEPPAGIDGISFVPTLLGSDQQPEHDYLYWEFFEQGGKQAVRWGDWKGIRLKAQQDRESAIMLFDLTNDLGEQSNVADQHPEVVAHIRRLMDQARTPSGIDRFRFRWEQ
ncbi:MAG: arylsulfatase [Planctomycetota bacterium]